MKNKVKILEIKIRHLENKLKVVIGQYEKTTDEYFKILDDLSKINNQLNRDITKRKKAEETLYHTVALLEAQLDSTLEGILVVNPDGKKVLQNKRTVELWKIPQHIVDDPDEKKQVQHVIHMTVEPEKFVKKVKYLYKHPAETTRDEVELIDGTVIDRYSAPVLGKDGKNHGRIWTFRDITERKQLEEERAKASKLESIGILAGGIAHDFNNILTVILGNTSLAKISLDNKEEVLELLTETEEATTSATKLTKQLLTFAKGGAPVKEITELTELIKETSKFSLRGSNVQYRTSIPSDLWNSEVDKGQFGQVISNLLINAQQATPEGGTINIKAKNVTVTPEDNLPLREGNYVKISLEDKGHGIPKEQLTKIFDPYFTTKQMGSGLGLATTYSIIHRHDGHIAVESELGVGTTFHIYLPASSKQLEGKEAVKEESAVLTGKILVMDDNEMVRKFVSKGLKSFGNDVDEASNGAKAIEKYKKAMDSGKPFDVVILDLTIPGGMGGKQAIKKLLKIDPDAKAVVSSGYANDPVISNFEEYGFSGFIPKPYKLEELKKVLNEVLSERNK